MKHLLFLAALTLIGSVPAVAAVEPVPTALEAVSRPTAAQDRQRWVDTLVKIADPVLTRFAEDTFKQHFTRESVAKDRLPFAALECFGRLMGGMAPWLELGPEDTPEGNLRAKYIDLAVKSIDNIVNPKASDYLDFGLGQQSLVDAAFLAQGMLRAPKQLWGRLSDITKQRFIDNLKRSRRIRPYESNWLLFATTVEAALLEFTGEYDEARLMKGIKRFRDAWYKGDGHYGDGPSFHLDYYNSFVIHPMLVDTLTVMQKHGVSDGGFLKNELRRFTRYAQQQERLISPEGTYPCVGRSIIYRVGAYHVLSQAALLHKLPSNLSPAQVRCALSAVIRRQFSAPGTFDSKGYLTIGFAGHQRRMGEYYINNGSAYLCSFGFVALGLPPTDDFWSKPFTPWSNLKAWSGIDIGLDHALSN